MDVYGEVSSVETLKRSLKSAITAFGDAQKQGLELCSPFVQNSTSQHATFRQNEQTAHRITRESTLRWSFSWTFREKSFSAVVKTSDGEHGKHFMGPTSNPETSLWHPEQMSPRQKGFYRDFFFHKSKSIFALKLHVVETKNRGSTVAIRYCALYTIKELVVRKQMVYLRADSVVLP